MPNHYIIPAQLSLTFGEAPTTALPAPVTVERVRTPIEEFAHSVKESLLQSLVPLIASDPSKRVEHRYHKYLPVHRRTSGPTVAKLCRDFMEHARTYYRRWDGSDTSEATNFRFAIRPLRKLYGRTRVMDFGPVKLKKVRDEMIALGWCRNHINQQVGRVKHIFKWAVENELAPPSIYHGLQAVAGLRFGRSLAKELPPVKPASPAVVEAILDRVSAPVRVMIQLQMLTGMRPGEVCIMRSCDIDRNEQPWTYRPMHHKTEHHNHERFIFLGPKTQELLRPFMEAVGPEEFLFSPKAAVKERYDRAHAARVTPLCCGNRPGTNRKSNPRKTPGDRYDISSYRRAIRRACELAYPMPSDLSPEDREKWKREYYWHPHQLRHNAATWLRKQFGLDIAQVILGHKTLAVTQVYAEKNVESAQKVMAEVG